MEIKWHNNTMVVRKIYRGEVTELRFSALQQKILFLALEEYWGEK